MLYERKNSMRIPRVYINQPLAIGQITLNTEVSQRLITVLRLKVGDPVEIFNHQQKLYLCYIQCADKKKCVLTITEALENTPASPLHTHLGVALIKNDKMDFAIQKSVELGVQIITPLTTAWTDISLNQERSAKKHEQWEKIIIHACEQCERTDIPILNPMTDFSTWIQQQSHHATKIILHARPTHRGEKSLSDILQNHAALVAAIGPEGGFSPVEVEQAEQHDFHTVCLGRRILRSETAPIVLLSLAQWLKGDFSY